MEFRYCRSDPKLVQRYTDELVGLKPDIIFAQGVVGAAAMKRATQTIPVVFAQVQDPVGGGFVTNLARPEGNLTGFTNFEYSIVGKWLQLLKDVYPAASRVMPLINPDNRPRWNGYTAAFEKYAPALGIKPQMAGIHDENDIEREIAQFAEQPNGGLVVLPDATTGVYAKLIISLSERYRLPAVYSYGFYARAGGLIAYSDNASGQYQQCGFVYRSNLARNQDRRTSGSGHGSVRDCDQHQDGCQIGYHDSTHAPRHGRLSHRVS